MKGLSVVGTAAMFMVGGAILTHGISPVHHAIEQLAQASGSLAAVGAVAEALLPTLLDATFGVLVGALVVVLVTLCSKLRGKPGLVG